MVLGSFCPLQELYLAVDRRVVPPKGRSYVAGVRLHDAGLHVISEVDGEHLVPQVLHELRILYGEDDLDLFVDSRGFGVLGAVNYALLYQLQGSPTYATRAWQIVEHALDNPYTGYTADTWIEFDDFYTAHNLVPAVALVLDWTWDWMNESRRERLAGRSGG